MSLLLGDSEYFHLPRSSYLIKYVTPKFLFECVPHGKFDKCCFFLSIIHEMKFLI